MSRISIKLKKVSIYLPSEMLPQHGQRIIANLESSDDPSKRIVFEFENEDEEFYEKPTFFSPKESWVKDMNQVYQKVMSTIITLATAALVLPILFL